MCKGKYIWSHVLMESHVTQHHTKYTIANNYIKINNKQNEYLLRRRISAHTKYMASI